MGEENLKQFCSGRISWHARLDTAPNTAEFTLLSAYRRDGFSGSGKDGLPVKGDIIFDTTGGTSLTFGDGTFTGIQKYTIIDFSEKENWILGMALDPVTERITILHTYPAPADPETEGPWKAGIKDAHRLAVEEHVINQGDGSQLETLVEFETLNTSHAAFVPVNVNALQNSEISFQVTAEAPNGDCLACHLATDVEASGVAGGFNQTGSPQMPNLLNVGADTHEVNRDNTGNGPGQFWSYRTVMEDGKSKAGVDAMIRIIKEDGEPPVCAAPDEIQSAPFGMLFDIDIVASDPDGLITGIEAVNLPLWASLNVITELPAADAIASISGVPESEDAGLHVLSIVATDNDGNQAISPLKINVDDGGFEDVHPEEKKEVVAVR